ncbi:ABC transporter substrate-binding protein [Synechococcales cyanobacterium C]|uniref:ABC transporter substrate-binding protein n=1 Tax=Petrachloros mirabilis ULC683 TaxID=2781853 RepID=A0A8K2A9X2_9CYAN|nr:iron-siderophore ABC transporter substrate-binding protein [Petrachloros mirabilis]NCJ08650.1 ABC transporter substrate-binding protein [Petrachloros mirabilis ULC683]
MHFKPPNTSQFRQLYRLLRFLLLLAGSIFFALACTSRLPIHSDPTTLDPSSAETCQIIYHAMGHTCVPTDPQRVVVWGGTELDPVLALGVKPIAGNPEVLSYVKEKLPPEQWQEIKDINSPQGPNLEYILELKPDLILGHESRIGQIYPQLSSIAPTVLDGAEDWKSTLRLFAEALNKSETAHQIMDDYDARINLFKSEMHRRLPFTISSVEIRADSIILDTHDSFALSVIQEAGLSLSPGLNRYTSQTWVLSKERLHELESDAIFLRAWGGFTSEQQAAEAELEKLKADPLWQQLQVVQKGKVYTVGDYFQGGGPITANLILDDLFRYLLPTKS